MSKNDELIYVIGGEKVNFFENKKQSAFVIGAENLLFNCQF
jgi:hypothetical protein